VERKVYAEVPPRVEYSLTARGRTLGRIIEGLKDWGREHSGARD
jgi:DNA-binding HxlR family transcriptional regulator